MLPEVEASASQGKCSVRKTKRKNKLYFLSKKALEKSRMKMAIKVFNFWGPSKLLDFGNTDVVDIASVIDGIL
jgi:hypothetical protein